MFVCVCRGRVCRHIKMQFKWVFSPCHCGGDVEGQLVVHKREGPDWLVITPGLVPSTGDVNEKGLCGLYWTWCKWDVKKHVWILSFTQPRGEATVWISSRCKVSVWFFPFTETQLLCDFSFVMRSEPRFQMIETSFTSCSCNGCAGLLTSRRE